MSIKELDLTIHAINWSYSNIELQGIRATLKGMLDRCEITWSMYKGLNQDIRNRADWLKGRR